MTQSLRGVTRAGKGTGPVGRATLSVCLPNLDNLSSLVRVYSHRLDIVEDVTALFSDLLLFQVLLINAIMFASVRQANSKLT